MKQRLMFSAVFLSIGSYTPLLNATCNTGTLTAVSGSPFSAGSNPTFTAYSPLTLNNLFVAAANNDGNNVSVYSVNTSTGVFTTVSGSPFSTGNEPQGCAFSPFVYENLFAAISNELDNTVSVYSVNTTTGVFAQVPGSPFSTGAGTTPVGLSFSPLIKGNLFAAIANLNGTLSVYSVNTLTGVFTSVSGSPFTAGSSPQTVVFSPLVNGNLFAAAPNNGSSNVSIYSVNVSTGFFTPVTGSPFSTGISNAPTSFAFSPLINGNLFAAAVNTNANNIFVYSVNTSTGALTQIGSAVSTGTSPQQIAFSSLVNGNLFAAVTNNGGNSVSIYQVNTSTGAFTAVSGSPFTAGTNPYGIAFSPIVSGGIFLAAANNGSNNISVFKVNALMPTLTTLSQYILSGATVTLNGTITGGTANYAITWQDGTVQSSISTTTFSRAVTPASTTIYDVATISDSLACTAGPSNSVTIGVRTCP